MMTLAVVSLLSAAIGAAVMVTVLHCRSRLSGFGSAGNYHSGTCVYGGATSVRYKCL